MNAGPEIDFVLL